VSVISGNCVHAGGQSSKLRPYMCSNLCGQTLTGKITAPAASPAPRQMMSSSTVCGCTLGHRPAAGVPCGAETRFRRNV
jgi:hypothetical protein